MNHAQRKKLIEVALPLEAINVASGREKSIRQGHPSTLHLWWARRPLATARAIVFAQMVDDPSSWPDLFPTERAQEKERQRLFKIIEELVQWENTTNDVVLQKARDEIWRSWRRACADNVDHPRAKDLFNRERLPAFHDPFAGGGALPQEAQRLGLESYASDLNPVAVLINKAMIEIPPRFSGCPPHNPDARASRDLASWRGASGLSEDVRYYGQWMRDEAEKRIGRLYPKQEITARMAEERPDLKPYVGKSLTVIAWLWARTVKSPNPAFRDIDVPLVSSFFLSTKQGKEVYVQPSIRKDGYEFQVKCGKPPEDFPFPEGTKAGKAQDFLCLMSGIPVERSYVRSEGKLGRLGARLLAVVADGNPGRVYLSPDSGAEDLALAQDLRTKADAIRAEFLSGPTPTRAMITGGVCSAYGLGTWGDLFTDRQIVGLHTLSELLDDVREKIISDHRTERNQPSEQDARAYAVAVTTYLALAIGKSADYNSSLCSWISGGQTMRNTFGRQGLPMVWDFAEANPLSTTTGSFLSAIDQIARVLLTVPASIEGTVSRDDARFQSISQDKIVSCDPPYYDNIIYAELSDFFYAWARPCLRTVYPDLFTTIATPKTEELVALPYRHESKEAAETFFLHGMTDALSCLAKQSHPAFPVTIYYAFKQSETNRDGDGVSSTGWETFLDAVGRAGFSISGTWPVRTELANKVSGIDRNMLASSIVLVCRPLASKASTISRREFLTALQRELPSAIADLQRGNIAPVDLQQAAIGPGMAIFTRYAKVLDAEGKPLSVRDALTMINQALDESLAHQEGDFDGDTRWALAWFEQFGFSESDYGVAEVLSKAKATSVQRIVDARIAVSGKGKVRLLRPEELSVHWNPQEDNRLTVWEIVHRLIRVLDAGEATAAELFAKLGDKAEIARELAYRLYSISDRTKRSLDAQRYNGLVQSWPEIVAIASKLPKIAGEAQLSLEGMN